MTGGWIKLHRQAVDHGWLQNHNLWIFWTYCLLKATHQRTTVTIGYQRLTLEPGQFVFGRNKAAMDLKLSIQEIRTSLNVLKKCENLTIKSTSKFSVITITNWHTYQSDEREDNQQNNKQLTIKPPSTNHIQEGKEVKNKDLSDFFLKLWEAYPKKDGRKAAERHYFATVKNESDMERIDFALGNYLSRIETEKIDLKFIKNGSTFFNNWQDFEVTENGK